MRIFLCRLSSSSGRLICSRHCRLYTVIVAAFVIALVFINKRGNVNTEKYPKILDGPVTNSVSQKYEGLRHDKWIVVTTIQAPTEQVRQLANIPGWQMVVIGDTKTPAGWSLPGVVYLSIEDQEQLPYTIAKLLPTKRYTRKNLGYLFAIEHGAEIIYETDDDNVPTDQLKNFFLSLDETTGLIIDTTQITYNPCKHFGQSTLWPRGYPLERVGTTDPRQYKLCKLQTPPIQQGFVNGDPDLDAIYRLTRKHVSKPLDMKFDNAAPPVILPKDTFSPMNSQNTLFNKRAFWALYLPTTVTDRVTDIYRAYWGQKLMWLVGDKVAFFPPNAYQARSPHSYISDAKLETEMYENTGRLLDFLKSWNCSDLSFTKCAMNISKQMSNLNFWRSFDVELLMAWFHDLEKMDYEFPDLVNNAKVTEQHSVIFYPNEQNSSWMFSPRYILPESLNKHEALEKYIARVCQINKHISFREALANSTGFSNVILVVGVTHQENILLLDASHRLYFRNIIYCGRKLQTTLFHEWNLTYVEITTNPSTYACISAAAEMRHLVSGYLYITDDTYVGPQTFAKSDFDTQFTWLPRISSQIDSSTGDETSLNHTMEQCIKSSVKNHSDNAFNSPVYIPTREARLLDKLLKKKAINILSFLKCSQHKIKYFKYNYEKNAEHQTIFRTQIVRSVSYSNIENNRTSFGKYVCSGFTKL